MSASILRNVAAQRQRATQAGKYYDEDQLPGILKDGMGVLMSETEKDIFLVGATAVISGCLPNVHGYYDGHTVGPQLYAYILSSFGNGKSCLSHCRTLAKDIEAIVKRESDNEQIEWQELVQASEKGNIPEKPHERRLFIPADSSRAAFSKMLNANGGSGIVFCTEGDTLASTLRTEYGNYSDILRAGFHHENVESLRSKDGLSEIPRPYLAVVLSSTHDQLVRLIPTVENGLFSRFLYIELEADPSFRNPFDKRKRKYNKVLEGLANRLASMYLQLRQLSEPIEIELTEAQQQILFARFTEVKQQTLKQHGQVANGTVNRNGLICYRIAMILTLLRNESSIASGELFCTDADFQTSMLLAEKLLKDSMSICDRLPKGEQRFTAKPGQTLKETQRSTAVMEINRLIHEGKTYREIAELTGFSKSVITKMRDENPKI